MKYNAVIGLEVHVELKTESKMFCACSADYFGKEPNSHTCPVCLGLPGALPVPNRKAIEWCIEIALALDCRILNNSKFDRKNYFYPDLAKGYQISQYDEPFGLDGEIYVKKSEDSKEDDKKIRIRRVHMEEDTGKLTHAGNVSLIDFNRSGVPLVEIVTEPDFENAFQVTQYLQKLQQVVRYLDVSNADMEKGNMRLEPNISLRKEGEKELPPYKVEVKNINSFRFVAKSIEVELARQAEILERGETPAQETRGWNEAKNTTVSQRSKEEAHDYRYFPEPDIPPIITSDEEIERIRKNIPELFDAKAKRFVEQYMVSEYDADLLTREKTLAEYFEKAVVAGTSKGLKPKQIANFIINKKPDLSSVLPEKLAEMIHEAEKKDDVNPTLLKETVAKVISDNPQAVEDYRNGKVQIIGFLIGKVRSSLPPNSSVQGLKEAIEEAMK